MSNEVLLSRRLAFLRIGTIALAVTTLPILLNSGSAFADKGGSVEEAAAPAAAITVVEVAAAAETTTVGRAEAAVLPVRATDLRHIAGRETPTLEATIPRT